MKYRIVKKEPFQVIGVKYEVETENDILSPTYEDMIGNISESTLKELEAISSSEPLGLVHVSTNYKEHSDGTAIFDQFIGAVSNEQNETYSTLEVPALLWVIFEVDGDWQDVEDHWQRIYSEWLPSSSYELAGGPELLASKEQKSEIWISIKKK